MTPAILVPHRPDGGWRDRLWAHCQGQWPDAILAPGPTGPFSRSAAINAAAHQAGDWQVAVIVDADVLVPADAVTAAVELATTTGRITYPYQRRRNLRHAITTRLLGGWPVKIDPADAPTQHVATDLRLWPASMTCSSCLVVPRSLWDAVGGFDERFAGWGWDDVGFHRSCHTLGGGQESVPGDLLHLWHPKAPERVTPDARFWANKALGQRYKDALGDVDAMRAILGEPGGPHAPEQEHS